MTSGAAQEGRAGLAGHELPREFLTQELGVPEGAVDGPRVVEVQVAAVSDRNDEEQLAYCRTITHDRVLAIAGSRRRTGVAWHYFDPGEDAQQIAAILDKTVELDVGSAVGLRDFLEQNPGGCLVVAAVEAVEA